MRVEGNAFLVTGGSSGLGAACVREFVGAGATVVIADLNEEYGERLTDEFGTDVHFVRADVAEERDVRKAVEVASKQPGHLRGAVNCAGIGPATKVVGKQGPHPLDAFEKVIRVNLVGTFNVLRLTAAAIADSEPEDGGERGVIVNTSSCAAFDGQIGQAAYSASKGGIVAMTLPVARELATSGIRVVTVAPGFFETPMYDGIPEKARQSLEQHVQFPMRYGQPGEFAGLVRHVFENQMLNGETVRLDGAVRMPPR